MIKILFTFILLSSIIAAGIEVWRNINSLERWKVFKTVSYAVGVSTISVILLSLFVILF